MAARLAGFFSATGAFCLSDEDATRIARVVEKMGRALWTFETGETTGSVMATMRWNQLALLDQQQIAEFNELSEPELLPEVGSRMLQRMLVVGDSVVVNTWQDVQPGRFSYAIQVPSAGGGLVKMVLGDYVAAEVGLGAY